MKIRVLILNVLILSFSVQGKNAASTESKPSEDRPIVKGEYERTQAEFVATMKANQKRIEELKAEKEDIIEMSKEQANMDREGSEMLHKYDVLLAVRYSDEKGDFKSARSLEDRDIKNLNEIFEKHLRSTLLVGRVSAGYARKMIDWAIDQLNSKTFEHGSPKDSNHPELEIVNTQIADIEQKNKVILNLAQKLGINVKAEVVANDLINRLREPASTEVSKIKSKENSKN